MLALPFGLTYFIVILIVDYQVRIFFTGQTLSISIGAIGTFGIGHLAAATVSIPAN